MQSKKMCFDTSREGGRWTKAETAKLKELYEKGVRPSEIAKELHRTPGAIYKKVDAMANERLLRVRMQASLNLPLSYHEGSDAITIKRLQRWARQNPIKEADYDGFLERAAKALRYKAFPMAKEADDNGIC